MADRLLVVAPGLLEGELLLSFIVLAEDGGRRRLGVLHLHRLQAPGVCGCCRLRPFLACLPARLWHLRLPVCSRMHPEMRRLNSNRRQGDAARPGDTPRGCLQRHTSICILRVCDCPT